MLTKIEKIVAYDSRIVNNTESYWTIDVTQRQWRNCLGSAELEKMAEGLI